jgi:hypothetical protein
MRENRLSWFGYVMRREKTNAVRVEMKCFIEGKREIQKPKKRWLNTIENEDCSCLCRGSRKSGRVKGLDKSNRPQIDERMVKKKKIIINYHTIRNFTVI